MSGPQQGELVLAICPYAKRISVAVFEGPLSPIDWVTKEVRGRTLSELALETAKQFIERYQPDVLVLRSHNRKRESAQHLRRTERLLATYAATQAIEYERYTREDIRICFGSAGALTRQEIAEVIAAQIAAFSVYLPKPRRPWEQESHSMALFDAASLAMTYYAVQEFQRRGEERSEERSEA